MQLKGWTGEAEKNPVYFIYAGPAQFRLAQGLGAGRAVYGIHAPWPVAWREAAEADRVTEMPTMAQLAAPYVEALVKHGPGRPIVVMGYSFAGLLAFEVAHQFLARGGQVEKVVLLDTWGRYPTPRKVWRSIWAPAPGRPTRFPRLMERLQDSWRVTPWTAVEAGKRVASLFARREGPAPTQDRAPQAGDGEFEQITDLFDERGEAIPWGIVCRLYVRARDTGVMRPLAAPGVLVRARLLDNPKQNDMSRIDPCMGWKNLFGGGLEVRVTPGNHHTMIEPPDMFALMRHLNDVIP
jgi:thioesterase domain-containing protein